MINDSILRVVLNDKTIGKRKSESIVGGEKRLMTLIGSGRIRVMNELSGDVPHEKWQLNLYDVLSCASI